jgi:hypothetical protein
MFKTAADATAGNATLTLSSKKTGARYTFKVKAPRANDDGRRFVSLLTGPDNTGDYSYLGMLTTAGEFKRLQAPGSLFPRSRLRLLHP